LPAVKDKVEEGSGYVIKGNTRDPCGDGTVFYLDCSGGYTSLHM